MNRTLAIALIAVAVSSAALTGSAILAQKNKKPELQTGAQASPPAQRPGEVQKPQPTNQNRGTDVTQQKGQTIKPREGSDAAQQKGKPVKPIDPCCGQGGNATRVTAGDLSRTPAGKNYVVDLTKHGTVFDLDSTSRSIDFSRIIVRTSEGDVSMEALLKRLLPNASDRSVLRIGRAKDLSRGKASRIGGKNNFTCPPGEACKCTGDDDCDKMFGAGVCGDIAVCNPTGCSCLPPIKN